jgi:sugar O-acyltransferase (sialic acid O-acetyltransferase NeuD family)
MKSIFLIGGGGHCQAAIDVIECEGVFSIIGILDSSLPKNTKVLNYPVIGNDTLISSMIGKGYFAFITIGQIKTPAVRREIFTSIIQHGINVPIITSPIAHVSRFANIQQGTIVMHGALVNAGAQIGENCIINSHSVVEHDCTVGDHSHISTGAKINGGAHVHAECFIGSGAIIKEGIIIGKNSLIGAGVTVLKDIPPNSIYLGKK